MITRISVKYLVVALFISGAAIRPLSAESADNASGKATVYSSSFKGKKTATGDTYNPQAATAASRTLPLGSKVIVKNRKTGKSTTVTINDKTGKKSSAVVDLSKGAANKIGVKGTAPVETKVIAAPNKPAK